MKNDSKKMVVSLNTIRAAWSMCISVVVTNALILAVVLPHIERSLGLYLPARTGGKTFYIDQLEFLTISLISLAIVTALIVLALFLHKKKKFTESYLSASIVLTAGSVYLATVLGNVCDELWGGAWSLMGVTVGLLTGIIPALIVHTRRLDSTNKA